MRISCTRLSYEILPSHAVGTTIALKAGLAGLSTDVDVPVAHRYSGPLVLLATSPLEQPPDSVPVDHSVRRLDSAQDEVVCPSENKSIEARHHDLFFQRQVPALFQLDDLAEVRWTLAELGRVLIYARPVFRR